MSDVCVVTGGGSGMGLSAALQMPKDKIIIVAFLNLIIDFSHFLCYNQSISLNKGGPYELKRIHKCIS